MLEGVQAVAKTTLKHATAWFNASVVLSNFLVFCWIRPRSPEFPPLTGLPTQRKVPQKKEEARVQSWHCDQRAYITKLATPVSCAYVQSSLLALALPWLVPAKRPPLFASSSCVLMLPTSRLLHVITSRPIALQY
jgi:hypothetical protein